ncbi:MULTISPECIES: hypothetical protein [unclassified Crossiella]|uniref:hypothetical protein n=1 Tax=unclassified Crossiella TaxID=2620835 RepID=UPI00200027C6|nr:MULTISPECIES: hypothetical protein [unclassified Crossiella]MCK2243674.1 hypothetical protein [Crossiella sp. S99.2]MCK2257533.1 hypothetical protein [Crossiella sp. S99.1]
MPTTRAPDTDRQRRPRTRWLLPTTGLLAALTGLMLVLLLAGAGGRTARAEPVEPTQVPILPTAPTPPPSSSPPSSAPTTAAPTTTPAPPPAPPAGPSFLDGFSGVGMVDVAGMAITEWVRGLVRTGLQTVLKLLGDTVLSTPEMAEMPRITELWDWARHIANALYVLLATASALILMAHESLQTRYAVKELLPRLVIGFLTSNLSLTIVGQAIVMANALSSAILGEGTGPANLVGQLNTNIVTQVQTAGIFLLLLASVLIVLIVILLLIWIVRIALTAVLLIAAPLALSAHALPHTEGLARLWWKAMIALLAVQIAQALVLVLALRSFFATADPTPGWIGIGTGALTFLVFLVLFYIEIKIPFWAFQQVWTARGGMLTSLVKYAIAAKTLGMLGLGKGARRGAAARGGGKAGRVAGGMVGGVRRGASPVVAAAVPAGQLAPQFVAKPTPAKAQRRLAEAQARIRTAGERARAQAIRSYGAPQATATPPPPTARISQPAPRTGSTPARTSTTPLPLSTTPVAGVVQPARISTPPAPMARPPRTTAVTPPRISTVPPSTARTPTASAPVSAAANPAAYTPARISTTPPRISHTPTPRPTPPPDPAAYTPGRISAEPARISTSTASAHVQPADGTEPSRRRRIRRRTNPSDPKE